MTRAGGGRPLRIVFLDRDTFPDAVALRPFSFPHDLQVFANTALDEVAARIADADVVITNKVPVRAAAIAGALNLALIAVAATGYDIVDYRLQRARHRRLEHPQLRGAHRARAHVRADPRAAPQHRRVSAVGRRRGLAASDQFCFFDHPIRDLAGARSASSAMARSGAVADLGRAFGMRALFQHKGVAGMGPLYTPFEDVLRASDVITLHWPLRAATRNMIAAPSSRSWRNGAADQHRARRARRRGRAAQALRSGLIAGAGFDVLTTEPPPADHPFMPLLGCRTSS